MTELEQELRRALTRVKLPEGDAQYFLWERDLEPDEVYAIVKAVLPVLERRDNVRKTS